MWGERGYVMNQFVRVRDEDEGVSGANVEVKQDPFYMIVPSKLFA